MTVGALVYYAIRANNRPAKKKGRDLKTFRIQKRVELPEEKARASRRRFWRGLRAPCVPGRGGGEKKSRRDKVYLARAAVQCLPLTFGSYLTSRRIYYPLKAKILKPENPKKCGK